MRTLLWFSMLCFGCFQGTFAEEAPKASEEKKTEVTVISVNDADAIRAALGTEITVEGKVVNAFWVRSRVLMITFREEKKGFVAVSFAKDRKVLDDAFDGDMGAALKGKSLQITGKVTEYNESPQIVIESPEQVKIIESLP